MVGMSPSMVTNAGSGQPHENRQPFLTLTLCIALQGIFPSQN
jgi:microcystin-dependent protein